MCSVVCVCAVCAILHTNICVTLLLPQVRPQSCGGVRVIHASRNGAGIGTGEEIPHIRFKYRYKYRYRYKYKYSRGRRGEEGGRRGV